ncbi:DUF1576 domain-containing protein [Alkaliphilus hydrothermalis]|uniref:DUF1576 domain-containing protein n=1 Tax=Alkaliphilus hydrothermalis TaxID=1482730 RepID=A0ABS2NRS1_9FIRM|nr:DUF1576 domain-containing protein [Alkaliphilus hydrothermalis]MBM7615665.1 hypothetical protein [Alkaliphilus hydrothermalis]
MKPGLIAVSEKVKFKIMYSYGIIILLSALIFNPPIEILQGMAKIVVDPSLLVSDYMKIANIGAAFFNSGLLVISAITIVGLSKVNMTGTTMAAIFTVGGFALFGKNIYNVWAILLGVFLYSRYKKENFGKFILPALFGTALGPIVSQISFGLGDGSIFFLIVGNLCGILAGFIMAPLASHFVKFHLGFNLYNLGFTGGMIGTFFMAMFRAFGYENQGRLIVLQGQNLALSIYLIVMFSAFMIVGLYFNKNSFKGYKSLLKRTGRSVQDFVVLEGFGLSLINMALLGFICIAYILAVGGQLNGPVIGGVFTIIGFGAFGKHIKNILPVMLGVVLAAFIMKWQVNEIGPVLAALFGTTLAPIAGQFGWKAGMIAGFLHMAVVMNVGYLHGGMNLYNNGLAGGLVAALMIPLLESLRREA